MRARAGVAVVGSRVGLWVLGIVSAAGIAWVAAGCTMGQPSAGGRSAASVRDAGAPVAPLTPPTAGVRPPAPATSSASPAPPPRAADTAPTALRGPSAPDWHVGDQWAFRWESSEGQGDYVWTVERLELVGGVDHYVVRAGQREIYFRKSDLATAVEKLAGGGELRLLPPRLAYSWPLTPGATWRQRYTEHRGPGAPDAERRFEWKVEREEEIRVGAGTFAALRIVARHDPTPNIVYEMWYAPAAKQWVRLNEHFPGGIRYRELTAFSLRS